MTVASRAVVMAVVTAVKILEVEQELLWGVLEEAVVLISVPIARISHTDCRNSALCFI